MANHSKVQVGTRYGDLTVLRRAGSTPRGAALYECRCERCGSFATVEGQRLTSGKWPKKDCGCSRRERNADLSGRTFGALTALRRVGIAHDSLYLCHCAVCGQDKVLPRSYLMDPDVKSCGCAHYTPERMREMSAKASRRTHRDGINLYGATKTTPNATNTSGYRWVVQIYGGKWRAQFVLGGKKHLRDGFLTPEAAHKWAEKEHATALAAAKIEDPREARFILRAPDGNEYHVNALRRFARNHPDLIPRPKSFLSSMSAYGHYGGWKIVKRYSDRRVHKQYKQRSGIPGIYQHAQTKRWIAMWEGRYLGCYRYMEDAVDAQNEARYGKSKE